MESPNYNYVPQDCQGDAPKFKGSVVLRVPSIEDRFTYMAEMDDAAHQEGGERTNAKLLLAQVKLLKFSYDHYVKVDLKRMKDGKVYSSVDELRFDSDCQGILQDISSRITEGFSLGNESGRTLKSK